MNNVSYLLLANIVWLTAIGGQLSGISERLMKVSKKLSCQWKEHHTEDSANT
jgi:hypothetical protein